MKKNTICKRIAFAALAAAMLLSMTACGTKDTAADEEESGESVLTDTAMNLLTQGGHSDVSGKEETVYVIADAAGTPNDIIDTVHLKNGDASDQLADAANLTDIENTKGDETYTDNGDGTITWNAGGSDIYYEGHSDADLPLHVTVSYTLDGKPVTADELAGQSGHLAITFSYENTLTKEVKIAGKTAEIYRPCAVVSGVLLDNNTCANVTVTNGKAVSDGDNLVAVGLAMPGLSESLDLDSLDTEDVEVDTEEIDELLPDSVTIEADVTDFSLSMTLTAVSWDIMDSLDLSQLEETADTASDSAADLQDGTNDLIDGAEEINSYLNELADGTGDLADGADELASGAASAKTGIDELNDGLAEMQTQVSSLPDGTAKLLAGAQALSAALQSGSTANPGVYEAILMMKDGADSIVTATSGLMTGAQALATGVDTIASSLVTGDYTNPGIYEAAYLVKSGLNDAAGTLSSSMTAAAGGTQSALDAEAAAISYLQSAASGASGEMSSAIQTAIAYIQGAQTADSAVLSGLSSASLDLTTANTTLDSIMSGAQSLAAAAQMISSKLVSGDTSDSSKYGVYETAAALNAGAASLSSNAAYLASVVATMNNGDNLGALVDGLQQLASSSGTLVDGVDQLTEGSEQLSSGLGELSEGADELADGASTVDSAAGSLAEGSETLLEGINTLNDEGIAKIVDLLDGDVSGLYDRLEAIKAFGDEPMTFSGAADGTDCSVIFIYKTAAVG